MIYSGNRGIPTGYVANLERRLAETERALFFALREIHERVPMPDDYERLQPYRGQSLPVHSDLTTPTTQQEKNAFVRSWENYPLGSRAETEAWFRCRLAEAQETSRSPQATLSSGALSGATAPSPAIARTRSISGFGTVTQPRPTLIAHEPTQRHQNEAIDEAVQAEIARTNRFSQAKRLAEADRTLYF